MENKVVIKCVRWGKKQHKAFTLHWYDSGGSLIAAETIPSEEFRKRYKLRGFRIGDEMTLTKEQFLKFARLQITSKHWSVPTSQTGWVTKASITIAKPNTQTRGNV